MTFWRPRQIKTGYRPEVQTVESMKEMTQAKCTIEAVTLFALAGTFEFSDEIIAARIDEFAALAGEFGASPDDMQSLLEDHDKGLAVPKQSDWVRRWRGEQN